jgi:hypothetical protein
MVTKALETNDFCTTWKILQEKGLLFTLSEKKECFSLLKAKEKQ